MTALGFENAELWAAGLLAAAGALTALQRLVARARLTLSQRVLAHSDTATLVAGRDGRVALVNPAFAQLTGLAPDTVQGGELAQVLRRVQDERALPQVLRGIQHGAWRGETMLRLADGSERPMVVEAGTLPDAFGRPAECLVQFRELAPAGRMLGSSSSDQRDEVTGLASRSSFREQLRGLLEREPRAPAVLLLMDLERFRTINNSLGHGAGDLVLQAVAERLRALAGQHALVARMGGDEFALFLPCAEAAPDLHGAALARRVLESVASPVRVAERDLYVSASVGIAVCPRDGQDDGTLLKAADTAMYCAKTAGRNRFAFHTPDLDAHARQALALEIDLRRALDRGEFVLHYQPKVNVTSGEVTGAEALLRWRKPGSALMYPESFVPLLEETGLIVPVGEWVLRTACRQNKAWQDAGLPRLRVAVNLSALQLDRSLAGIVESALEDSELDPCWLELEVTETAILQCCTEAADVLAEIQKMGVHISMDDFGTGYSSLRYLKRLPIDTLKIDRSFIQDLPNDADGAAITRAVIALAHSLRIRVVAEGVETEDQADFLRERGCDEAQGYAFGAPQPAELLTRRLVDLLSLPGGRLAGPAPG